MADQYLDIDLNSTKIPYDALTGAFTVGQVVTGTTSTVTATISADSGSVLTVTGISGRFLDNEPLTDPLGGAATCAVGLNDGTSWTDARWDVHAGTLAALAATGNGETCWVKGNTDVKTSSNIYMVAPTSGSLEGIRMFGVKSSTTAVPPVKADLISGKATGGASFTYDGVDAADMPKVEQTGSTQNITISGQTYFYGMTFKSSNDWAFDDNNGTRWWVAEECLFELDQLMAAVAPTTGQYAKLLNCKIVAQTNEGMFKDGDGGVLEMLGGSYTGSAARRLTAAGGTNLKFYGVDLSDQAHHLYHGARTFCPVQYHNCKINASSTFDVITATGQPYIVEFYGCTADTSITSSIPDVEIRTHSGDISVDTAHYRTGGADDGGAGNYALAMTPKVLQTYETYWAMHSPWFAFPISSGAGQTVTVYIGNSNSGTNLYNEDDVWLEVFTPPADGTAQYTFTTSRADILEASPAAVASDTSTWGAGVYNKQKLQVTVSPAYAGMGYCRVLFAKSFPVTAETLYVDPKPVVS